MRIFTQVSILISTILCSVSLSAQCPISVDAGEDIYLCSPPTPTSLSGDVSGDYLNFSWSPTTGMVGASTLNPTVSVSQTTTYVLKAKAVDLNVNSIVNGDFESGNSSFSSAYTYSPGNLWPEGVYEVLTDPSASHPNFAACGDHTSGNGNMMAINGNGTPNQEVWCQTITVQPNTEYAFSAWVTSLVASSPAQLQFSVNGVTLGNIFAVSPALCNWQQFYAIWNSGGNSSATICVVNQNTALSGNDFALDDISFSPICEVTDSVTVHIVNVTAVASPPTLLIPCEGAELTLNGTGSSVGPDITYEWDTPNGNIVSGNNTLNPVVNAAGQYILTVTNSVGGAECTKTATVNVVATPNPLAAWILPTIPLGCGGNSVTIFGNSTQGNVNYSWTTFNGNIVSGADQKNCVVNQPGDYTLLVTNPATGCTATADVTVTTATQAPVAEAAASGPLSCQQALVTLSGAGSSSGSNYSYAWNAILGGNLVGATNTINATVNGPGVYTFSVTNTTNNCVTVDTVSVLSNVVLPSLAFAPANSFNCTVDTLTLHASAAPGNVNFSWGTNGGNFASPPVDSNAVITAAGTYIVTITNPANGCVHTDSIIITSNTTPPLATVMPPDSLTCLQNNVTLSGVGSSTGNNIMYSWSGPGVVSGGNGLMPVVNAAGTYTLLVTNQLNFCTDTASGVVNADVNAITAIANATDTLDCSTLTTVLNSTGSSNGAGFTYQWSTSTGMIATGGNTPTPTVSAPGIYQLLLTNPANGCTSTDQAEVTENTAAPNIQIATPDTLTCAAPLVTVSATNTSGTGSYTYLWTTANGSISGGTNTLVPSVNQPGTYTLLTTNLGNGCTSTVSTTVNQEAGLPIAAILPADTLICTQPVITINAGGSSTGLNIQWTASNGGALASGQNSLTPTTSTPGTYILVLTNAANGCTATDSVVVADNRVFPPADAGAPVTLTCTTPITTLTAVGAGAFQYNWSTGDGSFQGNPANPTVPTNAAGTYILQVTDPANGCTATDTVQIAANQLPPAATAQPAAALTCVTQSLNLALANPNPALTYNWQTSNGNITLGAQTPTPTVDAPGDYNLTLTDPVNGCTSTLSVSVNQNIQPPLLLVIAPAVLTCTEDTIPINASGSGTLYQWSTSNGSISSGNPGAQNITTDAPGDYTVIATDTINGCTNTQMVTVQQDITPPVLEAGPDITLDCLTTFQQLSGTASAATTVLWQASTGNIVSGETSLTPVIDHAATYTLLVTNTGNGCTATDQLTVVNDANAPTASIAPAAMLTCSVTSLSLQGSGSSGNGISYNWSASNGGNIFSGNNSLQPVIDAPGTYTLLVTNSNNGCTTTSSTTVQEDIAPPVVDVANGPVITCNNPSQTLTCFVLTDVVVIWTTANGNIVSGQNTSNPVVNSPGGYTVEATNPANGCSATAAVTVTMDITPPTLDIAPPSLLTCAAPSAQLQAAVSQPGTGNFDLGWSTNNGNFTADTATLSPTVNAPGTYDLLITNNTNGCTNTASVVVDQDIAPPAISLAVAPVITCTDNTVTLAGNTADPGNYQWSGPDIVSGGTGLSPVAGAPGTYSLLVTAGNGCTSTAAVQVTADQVSPTVVAQNPAVLNCILTETPVAVQVSSPAPGQVTFNWNTTNGHFVSPPNSLTPLVDAPGNYAVTITNPANGCTSTTTIAVTENIAPPAVDAGDDALLDCFHPEASLTAGQQNTLSYSWSTSNGNVLQGATTASPIVDAPGTYLLVVTSAVNGCTASDEVLVQEIPLPEFNFEIIQPDCHQPRGFAEFTDIEGGMAPYLFSFDGGNSFSSSISADQLVPGNYTLIIRDQLGCTNEEEMTIQTPFFPSVSLEPLHLIELGDSVLLVPLANPPAPALASFAWTPTETLNCPDCSSVYARPFKNTDYTLTITDLNGCTATARTTVRVDRRRNVYAPNIFTPDSQDNNRFTIFARGVESIEVLKVFDRWGAQVWEGRDLAPNDVSAGWDGNVREKGSTPAVFVWYAVLVFPDGEKEIFSGDITVIR